MFHTYNRPCPHISIISSSPYDSYSSFFDSYDSYAHPAGMGVRLLNP